MKTAAQLDREVDDQDLADFVVDRFKHDSLKRTRLASLVETILRGRGLESRNLDDAGLVALARTELLRGSSSTAASVTLPKKSPRGPELTEELARLLPRFEFIARWLVAVTKKKKNRGPLGLYVKRLGKRWQVVSPIGGHTVTFETTDPALLFDYARRSQLGPHIRDAEEFRVLAYQGAPR